MLERLNTELAMKGKTDTPRTDEKTFGKKVMAREMVHADFARELERELNDAIKALERIEQIHIDGCDTVRDKMFMGEVAIHFLHGYHEPVGFSSTQQILTPQIKSKRPEGAITRKENMKTIEQFKSERPYLNEAQLKAAYYLVEIEEWQITGLTLSKEGKRLSIDSNGNAFQY